MLKGANCHREGGSRRQDCRHSPGPTLTGNLTDLSVSTHEPQTHNKGTSQCTQTFMMVWAPHKQSPSFSKVFPLGDTIRVKQP